MGKHTPGPWRVSESHGWNVMADVDGSPRMVGTAVFGGFVPMGFQRSEVDANAVLMAAAPELLEAAKFYVANCPQRSRHCHDRDCDGPMCRTFRAAIAKAEGVQS